MEEEKIWHFTLMRNFFFQSVYYNSPPKHPWSLDWKESCLFWRGTFPQARVHWRACRTICQPQLCMRDSRGPASFWPFSQGLSPAGPSVGGTKSPGLLWSPLHFQGHLEGILALPWEFCPPVHRRWVLFLVCLWVPWGTQELFGFRSTSSVNKGEFLFFRPFSLLRLNNFFS